MAQDTCNDSEMVELLEVVESSSDNSLPSNAMEVTANEETTKSDNIQSSVKQHSEQDSLQIELKGNLYSMVEQETPQVPSAKAVPASETEPMLSDDETAPKILTTLKSISEPEATVQTEETAVKIKEEEEEELMSVECSNEQDTVQNKDTIASVTMESEQEIAKIQLADLTKKSRNRTPKNRKTDENVADNSSEVSAKSDNSEKVEVIEREITLEGESIAKKIKDRLLNVIGDSSHKTPIRSKIQSNTPGTIEIPRELIIGSHDINSPVIFNEPTKSLQNDELIAILEGNDEIKTEPESDMDVVADNQPADIKPDVEAASMNNTKTNKSRTLNSAMSPEKERELALKQMMQIPSKQRGRKPKASIQTRDLISSLMSEWSDNESKADETTVNRKEPVKEVKCIKKVAYKCGPKSLNALPISTFKRSRVIKKKIIWDPDAPETAISYASLVKKPASPTPVKKKAKPVVDEAVNASLEIPQVEVLTKKNDATRVRKQSLTILNEKKKPKKRSPVQIQTQSPTLANKKRCTEIDRLLGDEGAINMLYALKHENNNAEMTNLSGDDLESKTKTIKNLVTTENKSPVGRPRLKRESTPQKQQNVAVQKKESARKKTVPKQSASSSWDYIYSQKGGEDSMIIRRRSNSSYSSTTSPNRLSIEGSSPGQNVTATISSSGTMTQPIKSRLKEKFEFAKPNAKRHGKNQDQITHSQHSIMNDLKGNEHANPTRRSRRGLQAPVDVKIENVDDDDEDTEENWSFDQSYEELLLKNYADFVHLMPAQKLSKRGQFFTIQLMKSIIKALDDLEMDDTCHAVLISSSICNGLDYSTLFQTALEKRRVSARELATVVTNFIYAIAAFKKPLVASVNGRTVGIGVTILPLFDLVFASEKATFEVPFAKIGYVGEGCATLPLTNKVNGSFINQLLYLCESHQAIDAHRYGLVSNLLNNDKFQNQVLDKLKQLSSHSIQALKAVKSLVQKDTLPRINDALTKEQTMLVQHWTSSECQEKLKLYCSHK